MCVKISVCQDFLRIEINIDNSTDQTTEHWIMRVVRK